jgi:hypothetical protein
MNKINQDAAARYDDTLIFEMDDHVEIVYVMDSSLNTGTSADTMDSSLSEGKELVKESQLSSSLPIQIPAQTKWRSETEKLKTFVAPHIMSSNSVAISGSLPSSRRSRVNPI